ncbi:MAG: hypothetical protein AABZ01_02915, partial [Gemmatimonadota bacterium]
STTTPSAPPATRRDGKPADAARRYSRARGTGVGLVGAVAALWAGLRPYRESIGALRASGVLD